MISRHRREGRGHARLRGRVAGISRYKERRRRRSAHRRHPREPSGCRTCAMRWRSRPPAAPGRDRAALPGAQGAGAAAERGTAGAAAARTRQRRAGTRCDGARARAGHAGRAHHPAGRGGRHRARARRARGARRGPGGRAGTLLRGRCRHFPPRAGDRTHARAARTPARGPDTDPELPERTGQPHRDGAQLATVRAELAQLPAVKQRGEAEAHAATVLEAEHALQDWRQRWGSHPGGRRGRADEQVDAPASSSSRTSCDG